MRSGISTKLTLIVPAFMMSMAGASDPMGRSESSAERIAEPLKEARIEIYKARRELLLFSGQEEVRRYRVGLGFAPEAQKEREGDGATPEGSYLVVVKNPQSSYYRSLGLNYPNREDGTRGLRSGMISEAENKEIDRAHERGLRPPWDTALGGEIYIHGRGSATDWTLGCVALEDADMKELYAATAVGTQVVIRP